MPLNDSGAIITAMRHARVCDSYTEYLLLWFCIVDDVNEYDGYWISVVPMMALKMLHMMMVMMIPIVVVVMIVFSGHHWCC